MTQQSDDAAAAADTATNIVTGNGATSSPAVSGTILGLTPAQTVTLVGMIAGAVVPGAAVAGLSISTLTGIAVGVANEVPEAITAFEEIKALADSGAEPTAEQWASWNAAADAAHSAAQAAADAVINGTALEPLDGA